MMKARRSRLTYRSSVQHGRRSWSWACHAANGEIVDGGHGLNTKAEARLSVRRAVLALVDGIAREDAELAAFRSRTSKRKARTGLGGRPSIPGAV